jgi:predicted nucleotidyltransferase
MKKELKKILSDLRSIKPYLRKKYNVKEIEVFGSFIRKEQKAKSDLDLLVTFSKIPGLLEFIKLENELSDKLGIKVDLVMKDSLKPQLRRYILNETVSV